MAKKEKEILKEQLNLIAERLMIEGKRIKDEDLIVGYDNGGGQSGTRENPFYPAYEKLLSSFTKTLATVKDLGLEDTAEIRSLDSIRNKFKVV